MKAIISIKSKEYKGGAGSGHRGHAGRPGKRGGSTPGKGIAFIVHRPGTDTENFFVRDSWEVIVRQGKSKGLKLIGTFFSEDEAQFSVDEFNIENANEDDK